jgi:hypothetical protein
VCPVLMRPAIDKHARIRRGGRNDSARHLLLFPSFFYFCWLILFLTNRYFVYMTDDRTGNPIIDLSVYDDVQHVRVGS